MDKLLVIKLLYAMCFSPHPTKIVRLEGMTAKKYSQNLIIFQKGDRYTFYRCADLSDLNQE